MATVWTFGDSFTERYSSTYKWSEDYIEWKGYSPKVYGNFVSETLNCNLQNMGKSSSDNYTIFETFCNKYSSINDNDVIIIGWSSYLRFRIVNKWNAWETIIPNFNTYLENFESISNDTLNEMLLNRENPRYINELNNFIEFINTICSNKKVIHWTPFVDNFTKSKGRLNCFFFPHMEKIDTETNGELNDSHFSEMGHQKLASELVEIILNNKKPKHCMTLI
jgi:hypothetical protein